MNLGVKVVAIHAKEQTITLEDGTQQSYDQLVLATGARPIVPPIEGLATAQNVFPLRTAAHVASIKRASMRALPNVLL